MLYPTQDELDRFGTFTAEEFERWLCAALTALYGTDPGRADGKTDSLALTGLGVMGSSSIEVLSGVYRRLTGDARARYQLAIGNLLRHADVLEFPAAGVADLITLLALTRAYSQLPTLDCVLGAGEWGSVEPRLFRIAMSALKTLQTGLEAYEACLRLVDAPQFPQPFVFDAYEVLIASRPADWVHDLLRLSPMMLAVLERIENAGDEPQHEAYLDRFERMMEALMNSVSAKLISEGLGKLTGTIDYLSPVHPAGRALHFLAIGVEESRIVIDPDSGKLVFQSRHSGIRNPLEGVSAAGELYLQRHCSEGSMESMRNDIRKRTLPPSRTQPATVDLQIEAVMKNVQTNLSTLAAPPNPASSLGDARLRANG